MNGILSTSQFTEFLKTKLKMSCVELGLRIRSGLKMKNGLSSVEVTVIVGYK